MDLEKIAKQQQEKELTNFVRHIVDEVIEPAFSKLDEELQKFNEKKKAEPKQLEVIELGVLDANGKKYAIRAIELEQ